MRDARDFYIRFEGHPQYHDIDIVEDTEIKVVIQKMELCLFTNKGEYIADPDFGCDLPFYLWKTAVSAEYIDNTIKQQFAEYIPELRRYEWSVSTSITEGTLKDILVVDITINQYSVGAVFR